MARLVGLALAMVALIGFCKAFNISKFESISNNVGVLDEWAKEDASLSKKIEEDFGLAFGGDKLYLVSRRNKSAVHGGMVSTLSGDKWTHSKFEELDTAQLQDEIFTLAGRLFLMSVGQMNDRIVFNKLFAWDDETSKWSEVKLEIADKDMVSQPLVRSPDKFISIDVPDQEGSTAFLVATDHAMHNNDSETSFSQLDVVMEGGKPVSANITFIARIKSEMGKAVLASARKDDRLFALVGTFQKDSIYVNMSNYAIDLKTKSKVDGEDLSRFSMPYVDYTAAKRIFQAKDMVIFLGPNIQVDDERAQRRVWDLQLDQLTFQDVQADFPNLPQRRIFAIDQKNSRLLTAGLKKGAFAAKITA